jgi:hypothetical protein
MLRTRDKNHGKPCSVVRALAQTLPRRMPNNSACSKHVSRYFQPKGHVAIFNFGLLNSFLAIV